MQKFWRFFLLLLLGIVLVIAPLVALKPALSNTQQVTAQIVQKDKIDGYPVILDGETLFVVRRGVGVFTAEDRANTITRRIQAIAENDSISADDLLIEKNSRDGLIYLRVGDEILLTITPEDAQAYRNTQESLAKKAADVIKNAILRYRDDRRPSSLLRGFIFTIFATFILLGVVWGIIQLSARVFPPVRRWLELIIPGFRINNFEVISSEQISRFFLKILQIIRLIFILFIIYFYLSFIFALFPWTRAIGKSLLGYVNLSLNLVIQGITGYIPNIFVVATIIFITYYILKFIKPFFRAIETGNLVIPGFYADWAKPTYNLVLFLVIALAAVVAFPYLPGFDSPAFRGISVFLGILFSLGSSSAIANLVGGIILIYTRAFQIGDRIQVGDVIGDVVEKTILVTRLKTATNKVITIPNSSLLNTNVINFSVSEREFNEPLILQTTVTLGYDLPWRKVHATLIEAGLATEGILNEPRPFVLQTSLDDFYVSYQLNVYTDKPHQMMRIYSRLHQNIQDKCNEVGIEIMSPHYGALRDGNQSTIPSDYLPSDYVAPPFRLESVREE